MKFDLVAPSGLTVYSLDAPDLAKAIDGVSDAMDYSRWRGGISWTRIGRAARLTLFMPFGDHVCYILHQALDLRSFDVDKWFAELEKGN